MDLHAPGIDARGAAMPGGPGNILIGRGQDSAWSLTSAGSDTNDQFVETLCGGSRHEVPSTRASAARWARVDAGTIDGPGRDRLPHDGPRPGARLRDGRRQAGRGLLQALQPRQGHPLAAPVQPPVARARSRDVEVVLRAPRPPRRSRSTSPTRTTSTSRRTRPGLLPIRDQRVDPRLPTKGTGQYEWKGFLSAERAPARGQPGRRRRSSTGTTSRRPASARPTASGATARSSACRCSTRASPRSTTHDLAVGRRRR